MTTNVNPINNNVNALYTKSLLNLLLNTSESSLPLITETTVTIKTPIVVVLIPPAVEPGEPPITLK